jgi:YfiH family protein
MSLAPAFFQLDAQLVIDLPGARALFTTRRGGVSEGEFATLNLGLTGQAPAGTREDDPERVAANRARVLAATGRHGVAIGRQLHGSAVARVYDPRTGYRNGRDAADGQATARDDVAVAVHVADCLPIALAGEGAVGMLHAGWRGLAAGVLQAGVAALRELGATGPLEAAIGPGAGSCCYEVGEEVHEAFSAFGPEVRRGRRLDLKLAAARALRSAGVSAVHDSLVCTICSPDEAFFSYRRDGGLTGRQAGVAWRI